MRRPAHQANAALGAGDQTGRQLVRLRTGTLISQLLQLKLILVFYELKEPLEKYYQTINITEHCWPTSNGTKILA